MTNIERFHAHVQHNPCTGCDEWRGAKNSKGYGQFSIARTPAERARVAQSSGNKRVQAHRWIFEQAHGEVETGYEVDHQCCNPSCVSLRHLQAIPKSENLALRGRVHLGQEQ